MGSQGVNQKKGELRHKKIGIRILAPKKVGSTFFLGLVSRIGHQKGDMIAQDMEFEEQK